MFVLVTPNGELTKIVRKVVEEEGARIDVRVTVVEKAGTSIKQTPVKTDLSADQPVVGRRNCYLGCQILAKITNPNAGKLRTLVTDRGELKAQIKMLRQ